MIKKKKKIFVDLETYYNNANKITFKFVIPQYFSLIFNIFLLIFSGTENMESYYISPSYFLNFQSFAKFFLIKTNIGLSYSTF